MTRIMKMTYQYWRLVHRGCEGHHEKVENMKGDMHMRCSL